MVAAHRSLPFGSVIPVTNLENGRSVILRASIARTDAPSATGRSSPCRAAPPVAWILPPGSAYRRDRLHFVSEPDSCALQPVQASREIGDAKDDAIPP